MRLLVVIATTGCVAARQLPCEERKDQLAEEGVAWLDPVALGRPSGTDVGIDDLRLLDVDADGRADLLLNHRGFENQLFVSRGRACGDFGAFEPVTLDGPIADGQSWPEAQLLTAFLDRDERPELVWNLRDGSDNVVYVGRFDEDNLRRLAVRGGQSLSDESPSWDNTTPVVGDVDGDRRDDVVWTTVDRSVCMFVAFGTDTTSLVPEGGVQCLGLDAFLPEMDLSNLDKSNKYILKRPGALARPYLADADYDGRDELWLNYMQNGPNMIVNAPFDVATRQFVVGTGSVRPGGYWCRYDTLVGNTDGEYGDDLVWVQSTQDWAQLLTTLSDPEGALVRRLAHVWLRAAGDAASSRLAQLNADDIPDLVVTDGAEVHVRFGTADGRFGDTDPPAKEPRVDRLWRHPSPTPEDAAPEVADVDGDGLDDLVWLRIDEEEFTVQVALSVLEEP
ncbi:MAG: VCBS repeat-containing protein [Myxococcales bacterium]|nr:VCBS repeat-containing protein [Myxococcales bacterium]